MKFAEINVIFTKKVAEYIANGYTINSNTMGGHQGEIAKIDLRKGDEVIRVLLSTEHDLFREAVVLTVGRNTDEHIAREASSRYDNIIWNNRLEIIEQRTFWQMQKNYRDLDYYIEGEAGLEAIRKGRGRTKASAYNEHPDKVFQNVEKIMVKAAKRHLNKTSFKAANIQKVWKSWNETDGRYVYYVKTLKHQFALN